MKIYNKIIPLFPWPDGPIEGAGGSGKQNGIMAWVEMEKELASINNNFFFRWVKFKMKIMPIILRME